MSTKQNIMCIDMHGRWPTLSGGLAIMHADALHSMENKRAILQHLPLAPTGKPPDYLVGCNGGPCIIRTPVTPGRAKAYVMGGIAVHES